jgi:ubiquilin
MSITVNMKTSSGTSFSIQIPDDSLTIAEFKKLLVEKSNIPVEQQRLIYSGHVLKDVQTLGSYGVKDGHTVHLVRGASNSTANQASTTTPPVSQSAPSNPTEFGLPTGGFPGMGGLGGMGGASFQQMQQQLMQNPALMREMMNSPAMQSVLQNPELIRSMLMNNPQMREVIERNPEVGHVLNDPAVLRQTLEMARNPELMREMMRNTDRAMSNIESHPEGFNLLRRMYTNVQEPMLNATTPNPQQTNPFAALFGQGGQTPSTGGTPPANPNTAPLPNPWGPPSTGSSGGSVPSTGPSQGAFPSLETGGLFDPTMMSSMLQNPGVQSMMQQMFSNPELMQTAINSNPLLSSMLNQNPQMRQMFQNPDFLRQMSDPNTINALMQMQSAMQQLQGTGFMNLMK